MGYLELMYLDGQATLDEIMMYFPNHNIYILDADTISEMVVVVAPNGDVCVTFEKIDDDDGTPDVYQLYDTNYDVKFDEVVRLWSNTVKEVR
jgi:hypothetical protein